ncbi:Transposon Ty3-I Gag-Pol polyprotein [Araneus ventricosus]|uniref:Transposon Ty3-I Gag-Pol polyprotein n=1 Tax=Araneus ventricosus TaxID=182803 RepID=A0A4Y2KLM3_ARAVE|nr:Transposon Ty3-I Gag-Pol polyprotein [Araneus ventricosus]
MQIRHESRIGRQNGGWAGRDESWTERDESRIGEENGSWIGENGAGSRRNERSNPSCKEEMRAHVVSQVEGIEDHVDGCIGRMEEEVQGVKGKIEEVKTEVQEKMSDLERRLSDLETRPNNFPVNPKFMYSRPTVKPLTFDGKLHKEFQNLFSTCDADVGRCNMTQHRINTGDHLPIKQYPRRLPFARKEEAERLVNEMGENGIIEESSGPWDSPIVLVEKKDASIRFCVDYRKLNEIAKNDSYLLPRIDDTLDALNGSQWFTTLDLKCGYWQVEIRPEDREKTAFTTGQGLWQFKVMPFGLCKAPATFERLMETVLRGLPSEAAQFI